LAAGFLAFEEDRLAFVAFFGLEVDDEREAFLTGLFEASLFLLVPLVDFSVVEGAFEEVPVLVEEDEEDDDEVEVFLEEEEGFLFFFFLRSGLSLYDALTLTNEVLSPRFSDCLICFWAESKSIL